MRGQSSKQRSFVSLIDVETLIAADHPIRKIRRMCDEVLAGMNGIFEKIYSDKGAPSIPPETLLKGKVLQALYTVRSDRQLCARLQTDMMFRWFADVPLDEDVFDASTYSKNQARLLNHQIADVFFVKVVEMARQNGWVSDDHFSVDSTLIDSWASMKSFRPRDDGQGPGAGNSWTDFKGQKRSNDTHASTTDSEAKLIRRGQGQGARLCFAGHAAMENRHGLCVSFDIKPAVGASESEVAVEQMRRLRKRGFRPKSVGADKGYHSARFVEGLRKQKIVPHPARIKGRRAYRVVESAAHATSQRIRKRIEEIFGWAKTVGCFRKSRYRGVERTHAQGQFVVAAWNLLRMANLFTSAPPQPRWS